MNTFVGFLLLVAFIWIFTLELRHAGLKGLVDDSKALANKAVKEAKAAMAVVGVKSKSKK